MAHLKFFSKEEILKIQKLLQLPHLDVVLEKDWGSQTADHRENIHLEVKKRMAHAYPLSDSSISHCRSMGGFAFTQYQSNHIVQIGFDLEESARVQDQLARRISKDEAEFRAAPSGAALWCAKEAAFKALKGPHQPLVVTGLELTDWQSIDSQTDTVRLKDPKLYFFNSIVGVVTKKEAYSLSFFICRP